MGLLDTPQSTVDPQSLDGLLAALGIGAAAPAAPPSAPPVQGLLAPAPPQSTAPPPQAAPQQQPIPAPPQWGPRNAVGDMLDNMFLKGSIQNTRAEEYQRQMANYQQALMVNTLNQLIPQQREAAILNPQELGKSIAANSGPQSLKGGESVQYGQGGPTTTAPLMSVDKDSGAAITQTPGATFQTGQLGGNYSAANGVISSGRTGQVAGTYSQPQLVPAGTTPGMFTPSVGGQPSQNPQIPMGAGGITPGGPAPTQPKPLDPVDFFKSFVLPHEGGLNPSDMNGSPTMYGFNQAANPDINVKDLTPDAAAARFATKYYGPSGAANLPPALGAMQADTYFINPSVANQILQQSGGDPNKYMQLRQQWMAGMVQNNPKAAPYAKAWDQRNQALAQYAGSLSGGQSQGQPQQSAPGFTMLAPPSTYKLVPGSQIPNGNPRLTYKVAPNGDPTPMPQEFTMDNVQSNRQKFYGGEQYKSASEGLAPLSGLSTTISSMSPSGVTGMALLDTLNKSLNPGGVVRPQTAQMFLDHLGVPAQVQSKILSVSGQGFIPKDLVAQIGRAAWAYGKAHVDQAAQIAAGDTNLATTHGFTADDVQENAPKMPDVPQWAQDPRPAPNQRVIGQTYWTAKGPFKWTGKTWQPVQ